MKKILLALALAGCSLAQQQVRWAATTGNVSQTGSAYTSTIQQPSVNQSQIFIDQIVVYCSVACVVTQSAYGTAATATAGTVSPILPSNLNSPVSATFWTASNVGVGTPQGGAINLPAGGTVTLCLSASCGNPVQVVLPTSGTSANYSVTISGITGTSNTTYYARSNP